MTNPKEELIRALLNWIIPSALGGAVIQMATKLIDHRETWIGAFLASLICFLLGCFVGILAVLAAMAYKASEIQILAIAIAASSFTGMIGLQISKWFVYHFSVGKFLTELSKNVLTGIANWILKLFK